MVVCRAQVVDVLIHNLVQDLALLRQVEQVAFPENIGHGLVQAKDGATIHVHVQVIQLREFTGWDHSLSQYLHQQDAEISLGQTVLFQALVPALKGLQLGYHAFHCPEGHELQLIHIEPFRVAAEGDILSGKSQVLADKDPGSACN